MAPKKIGRNKLIAKLVTGENLLCAFCQRTIDEEVAYGKLYEIGDIQCHYFCVLLSSCLIQKGKDHDGLFGFLYEDILAEIERSKKHKCSFCSREGATLGCSISHCKKQFHLPCGRERNTVSLFYGNYKSFCQAHAPKQNIPADILARAKQRLAGGKRLASKLQSDPRDLCSNEDLIENDGSAVCVVCYERVRPGPAADTFWPPCCARDAWFHRGCVERMALSAGLHYLKCPLCNDKDRFREAVVTQGYYVPDRDAAWELEQNAFSEIYERAVACGAEHCGCPLGRAHDADTGPWDIRPCLLCGSAGEHAACRPGDGDADGADAPRARPFVCRTCRPAAPDDLEALASSIETVAAAEARRVPSSMRGPVMPARMSLRRTKGRLLSAPSSSSHQTTAIKTEPPSEIASPNTVSSREDLNLKTPSRPRVAGNGPQRINLPSPAKQPIMLRFSPKKHDPHIKSPFKDVMSPFKDAKSPLKSLIENISPNKYTSPMKMLEESLRKTGNSELMFNEQIVNKFRRKFLKPKPMSKKRQTVSNILNDLFDGLLKENQKCEQMLNNKCKVPVREWCSPKKEPDIVEDIKQSPESQNNQVDLETASNSSADTFELPAEFVGGDSSSEPLILDTPTRLTTVDMRLNSSLEICERDEQVNVDVVVVEDQGLQTVEDQETDRTELCALKFSPYNKEVLQDERVDIDLESFKNRYLNEVARDPPHSAGEGGDKPTGKRLRTRRKRKCEDSIVLQYESKPKTRGRRKALSVKSKDIKVKIQWRTERLKLKISDAKTGKMKTAKRMRKKSRKGSKLDERRVRKRVEKVTELSEKKLRKKNDRRESKLRKRIRKGTESSEQKDRSYRQYILQCSPEQRSKIVKPDYVVPVKKRKYTKHDKSKDNLVQTSLERFFKVKPN